MNKPTYTATYSPDDNKVRLAASERLGPELYAEAKALGFRWAPKQEQFIAPIWTPEREDFLISLAGEIQDEDSTLIERAEDRAERFDGYAAKREAEGDQLSAAVSGLSGQIPFGQPILIGHHSEKKARKHAEQIENGTRKAIQLFETADYWERRAHAAIRHAKYKELPAVRYRRIKGIEADLRKLEKANANQAKALAYFSDPALTPQKALAGANAAYSLFGFFMSGLYDALTKAPEAYAEHIATAVEGLSRPHPIRDRWITHYQNRTAYEKTMLGEAGGLVAQNHDLKVGGKVMTARGEYCTITRVNKIAGAIVSVTTDRRYVPVIGIEDIKDYTPPTEEQEAAAKPKTAPICNYPGDGFIVITKAVWDGLPKDCKGYRQIGGARVKHALGVFLDKYTEALRAGCSTNAEVSNIRHHYYPLFVSDEKVKMPPTSASLDHGYTA